MGNEKHVVSLHDVNKHGGKKKSPNHLSNSETNKATAAEKPSIHTLTNAHNQNHTHPSNRREH